MSPAMPTPPTSSRAAYRLAELLTVVVLLGGFINLVHPSTPYPATLVIDGIIFGLMLPHWLNHLLARKGHVPAPPWVTWILVTAIVYLGLFAVSHESFASMFAAWRSQIGYAFVAIYIFTLIKDRRDLARLRDLALALALVIAIFGIIQYKLGPALPTALQAPADAEVFSYWGTSISRSNGLIGNTIVYSATLSLFYSLHIARWLDTPRLRYFFTSMVMFVAILTTFSRAAIVGAVIIGFLAIAIVAHRKNAPKFVAGLTATLIFTPIIGYIVWPWIASPVQNSFLYRGLFLSGNASVQHSNAGHHADIALAQQVFSQHPFLGVGIATQREGSQWATTHGTFITDGAIWARLTEGGLVLLVPYLILGACVVLTTWRAWRQEGQWVAAGLLAYFAFQLAIASFVNSAIFGKAPFLMAWTMFGIVVAWTAAGKEGEAVDSTVDARLLAQA